MKNTVTNRPKQYHLLRILFFPLGTLLIFVLPVYGGSPWQEAELSVATISGNSLVCTFNVAVDAGQVQVFRQGDAGDWQAVPFAASGASAIEFELPVPWRAPVAGGALRDEQSYYYKIVLPPTVKITNKRAIEAQSGQTSLADNEVIIKIKIPGFRLEVDRTGDVSCHTKSYLLVFVFAGFYCVRYTRRKRQADIGTIASSPSAQQLIARGDLGKALTHLQQHLHGTDSGRHNELLILQARLAEISRARRIGIIERTSYSLEYNRIAEAALALLEQSPYVS